MDSQVRTYLLNELSTRLFYGVYVEYNNENFKVESVDISGKVKLVGKEESVDASELKPMIRPMNTMTKDEVNEFQQLSKSFSSTADSFKGIPPTEENKKMIIKETSKFLHSVMSWLNYHNLDYYGILDYFENK